MIFKTIGQMINFFPSKLINFNWRTPKLLIKLKSAKQRNYLELGVRSQLSALEGVEGHAEAPGLD
jgi:hypothetical protein